MMLLLGLLQEGESGKIVAHQSRRRHGHGHGCCHQAERGCDHLGDMGLRPGKRVEMLTNSGSGPLVVRMDESRIALGRGMAMKIYVRRNEE